MLLYTSYYRPLYKKNGSATRNESCTSMKILDNILNFLSSTMTIDNHAKSGGFVKEDKDVQHVHRFKDSMVTAYSPRVYNVKVRCLCVVIL